MTFVDHVDHVDLVPICGVPAIRKITSGPVITPLATEGSSQKKRKIQRVLSVREGEGRPTAFTFLKSLKF